MTIRIWTDRNRCPRHRSRTPMRPECSGLEERQLLSTAAPALPATTLIPPAAEVANAAAVLTRKAGQAEFTKYNHALSALEHTSTVTPAQFTALVQDKAAIDAAIEAARLSPSSTQNTINLTSDVIDASFTNTNESYQQSQMEGHLTGVSVPTALLDQTFAEMKLVGQEVMGHASSAAKLAKLNVQTRIELDLGPSPDTNIWPGAKRDPLVVYYNGQVGNFVRVR